MLWSPRWLERKPRHENERHRHEHTCSMSLCLCSVCIRAALSEDAPGVLVYSAILSLTPVSWGREGKVPELMNEYRRADTHGHKNGGVIIGRPRWTARGSKRQRKSPLPRFAPPPVSYLSWIISYTSGWWKEKKISTSRCWLKSLGEFMNMSTSAL